MQKTLMASFFPGSPKESLLFRWSDVSGDVRGWSWHPAPSSPASSKLVVDFRGGTGDFGRIKLLRAAGTGIAMEKRGFATFMPEYPKVDRHGDESDRKFVLESWEMFRKEFPGFSLAGIYGHSRGGMQAWMFAEDADLHVPLAMDCPLVDMGVSMLMRPDLEGMWRGMGISGPEEVAKRRADGERIAARHGKVMLQLCEDDRKVPNSEIERLHGQLFGLGCGVVLKRYPGAHCSGGEQADDDAAAFFKG